MRRRAPFVKLPGDGNNRFGNTELTQAFEPYAATTTRPSRRQIINAAALAGTNTGVCCGTAVTGGGTGVGTSPGTTGGTGSQGTGSTVGTVSAKVTGLMREMNEVAVRFDQQTDLNSDITLLLNDLYTQTGYTPPIPVPTDPTGPS